MFHSVKRFKQALSHEECVALLKQERRAVLSVITEDGYPYAVPVNHWYCEEDGRLYFHGGKLGHKIDCMKANDKVSLCVMDAGTPVEGEWWQRVKSVVVFGRVEFIEDYARTIEVSRALSYKFTQDEAYIDDEVKNHAHATLVCAVTIEHMTGKIVNER
ncbi:MAG: pyridoxamine 5'-phosphate oxidase family protein [Oscillospiraceae bacterium]|nr:pyridoxamine 5'-phosphate oxidase family protein [Oscillospiraceae bacterium]